MSIGTYDYALQEICQRLDEAAAGLAGAQEAATEQRGRLDAITGSSARSEADDAKAQILDAGTKLDEAVRSLQAAKTAIESYIQLF